MPKVEKLNWEKLQPKAKDKVIYSKEKPKGYLKYELVTKPDKPIHTDIRK